MDFNFDYSYLKNGSPIVTISSLGLSFNRGAIEMLSSPEVVVVGYDVRHNAIGVRAVRKEDGDNIPKYLFSSRVKNDWVRIGARDFAKQLSRVSKIDFSKKARQFVPEYDKETETLIIIVDEAHLK